MANNNQTTATQTNKSPRKRNKAVLWTLIIMLVLGILAIIIRPCQTDCNTVGNKAPIEQGESLTLEQIAALLKEKLNPEGILRNELKLPDSIIAKVNAGVDLQSILNRFAAKLLDKNNGSLSMEQLQELLQDGSILAQLKEEYLNAVRAFLATLQPAEASEPAPEEEPELQPAEDKGTSAESATVVRVDADNIYCLFPLNSALVEPTNILKTFAQRAIKRGANVALAGYADPVGQTDYNKRLSTQRANNVRKVLESLGVDPAKITVTGKGETTQFKRDEENRRVTMQLQ